MTYDSMNSMTAGAVWPVVWGEACRPDGNDRERLDRQVREKVAAEEARDAARAATSGQIWRG